MVKLITENDRHDYIDSEYPHIEYVPVSTVKKKYEKPFDENKHLEVVKNPSSKYYGMNPDFVKESWKEHSKERMAYGTHVHKVVETYVKDPNSIHKMIERDQQICFSFQSYEKNYGLKEAKIYSEYLTSVEIINTETNLSAKSIETMEKVVLMNILNDTVPNFDFKEANKLNKKDFIALVKKHLMNKGLAGTLDLLIVYKDYFDIADIKIDKEIKHYSNFGDKMLQPVSHLENCNLEFYSIQIWLYALMIEKELGIPFRAGKILNWKEDKRKFVTINILDRKEEALKILKDYFLYKRY